MQWLLLAQVVLTFLLRLAAWLEPLLEETAQELDAEGAPDAQHSVEQMGVLFDRAAAKLSRWKPWHWRKRKVLAVARRLAVGRAPELFAAARLNTDGPALSAAEAKELRDACGL